ncbi:beta-propeller domain-containing protein [Lentzea sp. NPDC059081]|uniref:beta-propeller domain-containing protein n=1 Tax=Lentzea sp. NPDC059081 TaxID=3346719 RepID=UPI00368B3778
MNGKKLWAGAAVLAVAGVCVSSAVRDETLAPPPVADYGPVRLVAFDSCDNAVTELRRAMAPYVGPYGLASGRFMTMESSASDTSAGVAQKSVPDAMPATPPQPQQDHSTTNVHEQGVDEPDIVKTDGKRVFSIADGKLRVVDVASKTISGTVDLGERRATQLLVSGDRALVVTDNPVPITKPTRPGRPSFAPESGTELVLVDLRGLKEISSLKVDGSYLDARQIGGTARVVVRSQPRIPWVYPDETTNDAGSLRRNREILQNEPISSWLPRYELDERGAKSTGTLVDCANVSRPSAPSGTSMLTVLSFELSGQLGTGKPVSIVADGDTVYGTDRTLYVADDHRLLPELPGKPPVQRPATTAIHQFDISQAGPPKHVASGEVGGTLLNQYSLSEHEGVLRVATTTGNAGQCCWRVPPEIAPRDPQPSESFVTTLRRQGNALAKVGQVGGLGKGEKIYSVRFIGRTGYVVTFRQTDPLYTLDLSVPEQPRVTGELKITGFSAYLHPAGDGRLIGVGQEATDQGRTTGTQVSLFDVSNPAAPRRLAQHHLPNSASEAQVDPHAFLFWPQDGTLVVPVQNYRTNYEVSSLVLKVEGDQLRDAGKIVEPESQNYGAGQRRTIVIGDQLWSISMGGVQINARNGLAQQAWLPFTQ